MKFVAIDVVLLSILALSRAKMDSPQILNEGPDIQEAENIRADYIQTKWIRQKLNHSDEQSITFRMRYLVSEEHFKSGGPIFTFVGGEYSVQRDIMLSGIILDLAKTYGGILFHTDHRYYGEHEPKNISTTLEFFTARESLADLAHFIRTIRRTDYRLTTSKVILCGCSYAGSLAIWFRKLYPDLVDGVFASSAPVSAQVDFKEYYIVVGRALVELGSQQCYDRVKNGVAELATMFAGNRSTEAKQMLGLCNSFDHQNDLDLWTLFSYIGNIFANYVQLQRNDDIFNVCEKLMSFMDDLEAVTTIFSTLMSSTTNCIDASYSSKLQRYKSAKGAVYRWYYQACNEFGWFGTSDLNHTLFGSTFPVTLFTTLCSDTFGAKYTKEHIQQLIDNTNSFFGGKSLYHHDEKIYMTYGSLDPWSPMGYAELHGATVIPGASHCADFDSISSTDSPAMRASKRRLISLVGQWLA